MQTFVYRARDVEARVVEEAVRVDSERDLESYLNDRRLIAVSIKRLESNASALRPRFRKEKIVLFSELASYIKSSIPATEMRKDIVRTFPEGTRFHEIVVGFLDDYANGRRLFEAMARRPTIFSESEVQLMRAAAESGNNVEMLQMLIAYLKRNDTVARKIWQASFYPLMLTAALIVSIAIYSTVMLPQLVILYTQLDITPIFPIPQLLWTMALIHNPFGLLCGAAMAAGTVIALSGWRKTTNGRERLDLALMNMPLFGRLVFLGRLAKTLFVLQLMLEAGQRSTAFLAAQAAADGAVFRGVLARMSRALDEGRVVAWDQALETAPHLFDPLLLGMIRSGERNGVLSEKLQEATLLAETRIDEQIGTLPEKLQVAVTISFTVIIGFFVYAMVIPTSNAIAHLH
ncbi:MAG TPA: type II secretion system F family protein [Candidatus Baltobacteraceae bacterium]|nr:type II secretion system F family protein [Candidatus Baltobacteraceae bacterium]